MSLLKKAAQYAAEKGWRDKIRKGDYYRLLKAHMLGDIKEGDLIRVGQKEYLIFIGMNKKGDTGIEEYTKKLTGH